jgi:hypothetical protein
LNVPLNPTESSAMPEIGIVIPACDEAPVIGAVLTELLDVIDGRSCAVIVGVNASTDATAEIARSYPVLVAETNERGYGYGCMAAIALAERALPTLRAFVFFAGDGASDPHDVARLIDAFHRRYDFVLGARTTLLRNWRVMTVSHVIANCALAAWCGLLARRWFKDLAPLRLIERRLFHAIAPREMTYGWTIEAQIAGARCGARICEVTAHERPRLAGQQKVSGVTWRRTVAIGCRIVAAGLRTSRRLRRRRPLREPLAVSQSELLPQPERSI